MFTYMFTIVYQNVYMFESSPERTDFLLSLEGFLQCFPSASQKRSWNRRCGYVFVHRFTAQPNRQGEKAPKKDAPPEVGVADRVVSWLRMAQLAMHGKRCMEFLNFACEGPFLLQTLDPSA